MLEYGGSDRSIFIQMPSALSIPMNMPRTTGAIDSEPEPHLGGRRMHCPRGKVLGGSSSINGLVYVRGNPLDFDRWEEEGAAGWGYRARAALFPPRREPAPKAATTIAAATGRSHTRYGTLANPLYARLHRGGARRPAMPRPTTSTATGRRASAAWT